MSKQGRNMNPVGFFKEPFMNTTWFYKEPPNGSFQHPIYDVEEPLSVLSKNPTLGFLKGFFQNIYIYIYF